jgi:hypothetical protein
MKISVKEVSVEFSVAELIALAIAILKLCSMLP